MKRVIVTGAAGFCGRHLCRFLAEKGYRVFGLSLHPADERPWCSSYGKRIICDITDREAVARCVRDLRPDYVCHLAAQSIPRLSWSQEDATYQTNTAGTIYLLNALRRYRPQAVFLLASSIQVYGRTFRKAKSVKEEDLLWPLDPYATSKALAEFACLDFHTRFGLRTVIARAFNHVGPGQPPEHAFSDWCRQIAWIERGWGEPVIKVGNLNNRRDFLHVADVVSAYELLLRKGTPGRIYNVASGRLWRLRTCLDYLVRQAMISIRVEIEPERVRKNVAPIMAGDASRLRRLGWRPRFDLRTALDELLDEWREKVAQEILSHV